MKEVYLDNSATTKVCRKAAAAVVYAMENCYGNPSSLHSKGFEAEKCIEKSRNIIAGCMDCTPREIYFTSGGTESNNIAVMGAVNSKKKYGNKIISTAAEHSSVLMQMKELEKRGLEVVYIKPDKLGNISYSDIEDAADNNTILISVMMVNNETGSIYPVNKIKRIINSKSPRALFHVDAVQGFGKIPFKTSDINADLLSISSHKIHGPKGAGALYISKGVRIQPLSFGGGQERGIRPGTEDTPAVMGFSEAVRELGNVRNNFKKMSELNRCCREKLLSIGGIGINSPEAVSPYILNIFVEGIRSETMLNYLSSRGVYVSSGSACAKGKRSHVLESMDMPGEIIDSSLRISFSIYNTLEDVNILTEYLKQGIRDIAKR